MLCPDCVNCCKALSSAGVSYKFLDFSEKLSNLKEFLTLRDSHPAFDDARVNGYIGIPCILNKAGELTLDWTNYVSQEHA